MTKVAQFERNLIGRDFAVGDIHGQFSRLHALLGDVQFDGSVDRLFSVGDMVDRGPESWLVLDWLKNPWFHAVQGNHEDFAIRHVATGKIDTNNWRSHGGGWFLDLPLRRQSDIALAFVALPTAIEVDTPAGMIGIVHADCPSLDWSGLRENLLHPVRRKSLLSYEDQCMWSRRRFEESDRAGVRGVVAMVVGHTPNPRPVILGNVYDIDTGAGKPGGHLTLLNLTTLQMHEEVVGAQLDWGSK